MSGRTGGVIRISTQYMRGTFRADPDKKNWFDFEFENGEIGKLHIKRDYLANFYLSDELINGGLLLTHQARPLYQNFFKQKDEEGNWLDCDPSNILTWQEAGFKRKKIWKTFKKNDGVITAGIKHEETSKLSHDPPEVTSNYFRNRRDNALEILSLDVYLNRPYQESEFITLFGDSYYFGSEDKERTDAWWPSYGMLENISDLQYCI